jgi:hypothetical protein
MRKIIKRTVRTLLVLALAIAVIGYWKGEQITRLLAVNSLFSEDKIVHNFSNMNEAFLTREVPRGDAPVSPLPKGEEARLPDAVQAWVTERHVTSLLALKDGKIMHESYYLGTKPEDLRISWSVAKSYLSALFGILLDEGKIASLDDPVTKYVPALAGSAYAGASLKNVLQMSSGVEFNEDYLDFYSDINKMGRVLALGGSMDGFAAGLSKSVAPPGKLWHYVSIDTHVIGMVIRGATGRDIPDLISEKIIAPLGYEAAPYYITDGDGVAFALGGLNVTTRDYARFGLMIEQNGTYGGKQIVPAGWIKASTVPSASTAPGEMGYGYQWWVPKGAHPGEFFAHGIYGQYIYIDQSKDVVIVSTMADRKFREPGVDDQNIAMFRQIAGAL